MKRVIRIHSHLAAPSHVGDISPLALPTAANRLDLASRVAAAGMESARPVLDWVPASAGIRTHLRVASGMAKARSSASAAPEVLVRSPAIIGAATSPSIPRRDLPTGRPREGKDFPPDQSRPRPW